MVELISFEVGVDVAHPVQGVKDVFREGGWTVRRGV